MAQTPARKILRWAQELANSSIGTPPHIDLSLNDASLDSVVDAEYGGLAHVNAQLLAHGFAHGDGLQLDGLDSGSAKMVVKCVMGLLSQRANDVKRTEELTSKYRSLGYDHERLLSMHSAQQKQTARAEEDVQRFKARLATAQREATTAEAQRKTAAVELVRTRTALQTVRTASQQEAKRLEKDRQTFADRFIKISDAQVQLGYVQSGIRFNSTPANAAALGGASVGSSNGELALLEDALRTAEDSRRSLAEENSDLREIVLEAARRMQESIHDAQAMANGPDSAKDLQLLSASQLFTPPISALTEPENAQKKFSELANELRDAMTTLGNTLVPITAPHAVQQKQKSETLQGQIDQLQAVIMKLTGELEQAKQEAQTFAAQSQTLFDQLQADEPSPAAGRDLYLEHEHVDEKARARLEAERTNLDEDRRAFTEAAIGLGRQRAELEAAKLAFMEEKRTWQVKQILAEAPPAKPVQSVRSPPRAKQPSVPAMPSIPFPASSLESLLRPQVGTSSSDDLPQASSSRTSLTPSFTEEAPAPGPSKSPRRSPRNAKHVAFAATSPLKRRSPPKVQTRSSRIPASFPKSPEMFPRLAKHAFSPARPSPLSKIMMMADDSDILDPANDGEYVTDEEFSSPEMDYRALSDEHDMFPPLGSAQRSPTKAMFPPLPASLAVELKLGASGQRAVKRVRPPTVDPADVSFPPPSSLGRVSFEFHLESDRPEEEEPELPKPSAKAKGKLPVRVPSPGAGNSSDDLDEDLKIVKGSKATAAKVAQPGTNKENKRPPVTGMPRTTGATTTRMPLSPRKTTSANAGGVKAKSRPSRVPVVPAPTAPARKPSPVSAPPAAAPVAAKAPGQITKGPIRGANRVGTGWR